MQPTSGCNMNCTYCYVPDRKVRDLMPLTVVENFFKVLSESELANRCRLLWHAGEPLMAGIPFYEKVFDLQKKYDFGNTEIINCIQTNGILISDKWCKLFKEYDIKISISLDGPKSIHDSNRVKWNGKGTFDEVMKGIKYLQKWDVDYEALAVLTKSGLDKPNEYFNFLVENKIKRIGINIEELNTQNKSSSMVFNEDEEDNYDLLSKYNKFMSVMFALWKRNHRTIDIRELSQMYHIVNEKTKNLDYRRISEEHKGIDVLNIKKNGDVSTFSPELIEGNNGNPDEFKIGNVATLSSFQDLCEAPKFLYLQDEVNRGIEKCKNNCQYFDFCGGGHLSAKYFEQGTFNCSETNYCKLHRQTLVDVVIDGLSNYS